MNTKYGHAGHISIRGIKKNDTWRYLVEARSFVENHIFWDVGNGSCSLWFDKWVKEGSLHLLVPILDSKLAVISNFWSKGAWNGVAMHSSCSIFIYNLILSSDGYQFRLLFDDKFYPCYKMKLSRRCLVPFVSSSSSSSWFKMPTMVLSFSCGGFIISMFRWMKY